MDTNQETNRERLPQKQAAQGKSGSETDAKGQEADGTNKPEKEKRPRKTDAELLVEVQKKLKTVADKEREVKARLQKTQTKELVSLKIVIGNSCLNYLRNPGTPEQAARLVNLVRKSASDCDKGWISQQFDRLIDLHTKPKPKSDESNGKSPSPS